MLDWEVVSILLAKGGATMKALPPSVCGSYSPTSLPTRNGIRLSEGPTVFQDRTAALDPQAEASIR
jgi:hypothetical protein